MSSYHREKAGRKLTKALRLQDEGRVDDALALFEEAAAIDPSWGMAHFNVGLVYKRQKNWRKSFEHNRRAAAAEPDNQPAWWNLGIAATALGDWAEARRAWRGFGIPVPDGDGPIDFPCGATPVRIHYAGGAEVVWANRLDPARAKIFNIPFPESGYRFGDIVLNDGAPTGYRRYDGRDVPVFDALEKLETSRHGTYIARIKVAPDRAPLARLSEIAAEQDGSAEDWSTSTALLCKACSEGRPHAEHDALPPPADGVHLVGLAATSRDHASRILSLWEEEAEGAEVESLDDALEPG